MGMEVIHPRCAGIDCSKKDAKVCIRIQGQGPRVKTSTVSTWGATTGQILTLREQLVAANVTCVVIESTSDYWKPFYYLLDDDLDVILVNAASVRNLPGRKTDVSDAAWLADLGAHGLVKASFVPPAPVRALRDLTRTRTVIPGNALGRCSGWRNCSKTPASNCRPWPPISPGYPGGPCSRRLSVDNATPPCSPSWPSADCGRRSRP